MAQLSFISATKLVELLNVANTQKDMHIRVLTTNQLALGVDPLHPTSVIDLSKEAIRPYRPSEAQPAADMPSEPQPAPTPTAHRAARQTGTYLLDVKGKTTVCISLKEMLAEGLKQLEAHKSGTLEKLSTVKPRTKRIVAYAPTSLFDQPELAEKYSEKLMNGWWFGTNNSADETNTWLKRGCELAGLEWGKDFTTSL